MVNDSSSLTFAYLVSCVRKTDKELLDHLAEVGIKGTIIVCNQLSDEDRMVGIQSGGSSITIFHSKDKGVSASRNRLLRAANADIVCFLDDDILLNQDFKQREIEDFIVLEFSRNQQLSCVRFNVRSLNPARKIHHLEDSDKLRFRDIKSFGVWGCFFRRSFLLSHSLIFDERIGPGTAHNHGEDTKFLKDFLDCHGIIKQDSRVAFLARQDDSTWQGANRDIKQELCSQGFLYRLLFKRKALLYGAFFLIKHRDAFPKELPFFKRVSYIKQGIQEAKHSN